MVQEDIYIWINRKCIMTFAFFVALGAAIIFAILWSEAREKLEKAELRISQLLRENKKLKSKGCPVVAEKPRKTKGFAIPKPVKKRAEPLLDPNKLSVLREQTKVAQNMLAEIFIQEDEKGQETVRESDMNPLIDFLGKLMTKEQWTRSELTELFGPDVMLGNLLEQVNDYAYTRVNDVVVEEDDNNIYVTIAYKEQLI